MEPLFFATLEDFRAWLAEHGEHERELIVGYYKRGSDRPSMTWPESVDEALCVGWIDGVRRSLDAESYTIRFTPRRRGSIWSAVNVGRVEALASEGRMTPRGLAAFEAREDRKTGVYSFESGSQQLDPALEARFREASAAWSFFEAQPPGYRRLAVFWVQSAKREETRLRRLDALIACSARGERVPQVTGRARPASLEGDATARGGGR